jgi:hypothetical protein
MSNKKVYLAKSPLASGFDIEYVKSNLLRIPDISVVEYSSGICPSKCRAVVYVHDEDFDFDNLDEDEPLSIGKSPSTAISEFLDGKHGDTCKVYIYTRQEKSEHNDGDAESTTPRCIYSDEFEECDEHPTHGLLIANSWNDGNLLEYISCDIDNDNEFAWKKNPRHYTPAAEYAMPEIPSVEERELKKTAKHIVPEKEYIREGRRLLLRKRR